MRACKTYARATDSFGFVFFKGQHGTGTRFLFFATSAFQGGEPGSTLLSRVSFCLWGGGGVGVCMAVGDLGLGLEACDSLNHHVVRGI